VRVSRPPFHASRSGARRAVTSLVLVSVLLVGAIGSLGPGSAGVRAGEDPKTVEWVCANTPDRVRALFDSLDLDRPGLSTVKKAVLDDDYPAACNALLQYYRTVPRALWLRRDPVPDRGKKADYAERILADTLFFYNEPGRFKRTRGGGIDWSDQGPTNQAEWRWALNTLMYGIQLSAAYFSTGRREYLERIDQDVRDWILANPCPGRQDLRGNWRGIEAAARVRVWLEEFYSLQACDEFSPATRILMLSSLLDHAHQLLLFHRRGATNWAVIELSGLATIGAAWPEFQDAAGWRRYAEEHIGEQLAEQVYPDGVQTELTIMYHRLTTESFERFMDVFHEFHYPVSDSLHAGVERMWNYIAYTTRPDGTTPENNDSERQPIRDKVLTAAAAYHRPDWSYIVTNGQSGRKPKGSPTITFPWAGHTIMRSGWDADSHWALFDTGPYGTGHQHRDKLHLSVDAFGRALLVDAGRYTYEDNAFRDYFTGSAAHNVIRIDRRDQRPGAERATEPMPSTEYGTSATMDYARGIFSEGYEGVKGEAIHTRAVIYVQNKFWVVADRIETDRPRTVEALWHFAPDCHVTLDGRSVVSDDAGLGNLRIVPVGGVGWSVDIMAGAKKPIQGWYSRLYGEKEPCPTAVYTAQIPGTTTFAWVLLPAKGAVPAADTRILSSRPERIELRVQIGSGESYVVTVPMNAWRPSVRRGG
jgi:hypothetical protein